MVFDNVRYVGCSQGFKQQGSICGFDFLHYSILTMVQNSVC